MEEWELNHAVVQPGERTKEYNRISDELGADGSAVCRHPDYYVSAMQPLWEQVIAIPATTIAGLAVKARVMRFFCQNYWEESDADADVDVLLCRKLCDAVIDMASRSTS